MFHGCQRAGLRRVLEPEPCGPDSDADYARIVRSAPIGAFAIAGIATGIVFALWLAFYMTVFLPRGVLS